MILTPNQKVEVIALLRKGWIQRLSAVDSDGYACLVNDEDACRFCVLGAIERVAGYDYRSAFNAAHCDRYGEEAWLYNDATNRTVDEVIERVKELA